MRRKFVAAFILSSLALLVIAGSFIVHAQNLSTLVDSFIPTSHLRPLPAVPTRWLERTPPATIALQSRAPLVNAQAAYLVNNDTNQVLSAINSEKPLPMASTTKIMTAVVAIQTRDLDQMISVQQDALNHVQDDGGSSANLAVGDELSLHDMLYALLLPSGDDAAIAIADTLGGTQANFVQEMNSLAQNLHLYHTHYDNADGLNSVDDTQHYSSAQDLVKLAQYAMSLPLFAEIVGTPNYSLASTNQHQAYSWTTTNTLLQSYPGMLGIKTGHTDAAGYCLVFAARQDDRELIGVVLDTSDASQRDMAATQLLNWGFSLH